MKKIILPVLSLLLFNSCKDAETITIKEAIEAPKDIATIEALKNPVITNVTSNLSNGNYNSGDIISINIEFDKIVKVTGIPKLELNFNGIKKEATYFSGSGTSVLEFRYTLTNSDQAIKLSYVDQDSLILGSSEIKDVRGANAQLDLPIPGDPGSLDSNKNISVSLNDSFNNGVISNQWTKLDQDNFNADSLGTVDDDFNISHIEQNGVLTISTRGSDLYGTSRQMNGIFLDNQTGDFDYSVQIINMTNTNTLSRVGFFMTTDMTTSNGGVYFCGTTGSSNIAVSYSSTNNNNININLTNGTSVKPVWIRIKKQNKDLSCYFKFNESDPWTAHSSGVRTVTDSTTYFDIGIVGSAKNTGATMQFQIDDFKKL